MTLTASERKDGRRQELSEDSIQQSRLWILCLQVLVPFEILFAARSREGLEVGHYEEDSLYRTGPGFVIIFPASSDELQFCLAFFP